MRHRPNAGQGPGRQQRATTQASLQQAQTNRRANDSRDSNGHFNNSKGKIRRADNMPGKFNRQRVLAANQRSPWFDHDER
jgi:hypothetical protein